MALLSPLFLVGALAAAVPVVLHLLKRHPEALVKFSAVRLLKNAPVEHANRRHLRELLLLALRVMALLLCAVAFARPYFTASAAEGGAALVVALDTSDSMSGAGRFERARALATQAIDGSAAGTSIAVVVFNDTADVVSGLSADRALARAAIAAAQPSPGATRYRGALSTALQLLRGHSGGLLVVTDLQGSGWESADRPQWPSTLDLQVADVGAPETNLALTAAQVTGDRVAVTVRNGSVRDVDAELHLEAGAADLRATTPAGDLRVPVAAGQSAQVVFPRPQGRWAAVRVADAEGAAADNTRFVLLDGSARPRVLVITATGDVNHEAFYVEQALVAGAGSSDAATYQAVGVAGSALASWDAARLESHASVVLMSTRGLDHRGRELLGRFLQNGGGLLVAAGPDVDGDVVAELVGAGRLTLAPPAATPEPDTQTLAPGDFRHPVLQPFSGRASLGLATFKRVTMMRAPGCQTLARFTNGQPALAECEAGRGRALVLAADLDNRGNDFPLHATFLPFVHQSVRYLGGERRSLEMLVGHTSAGVPSVPGIAPLNPGEPGGALVAVNVDPGESEPARMTPQEFQNSVARIEAAPVLSQGRLASEQEAQQHVWQYLLAAMLAMLLVESVVSMRTA